MTVRVARNTAAHLVKRGGLSGGRFCIGRKNGMGIRCVAAVAAVLFAAASMKTAAAQEPTPFRVRETGEGLAVELLSGTACC